MAYLQSSRAAHVSAVAQALGPAYRDAAAQAFTHGYHLAVGMGAICVLGAAVPAFLGFRQPLSAAAEAPESLATARQ